MHILIASDSLALPRPHRINDYHFENELAVHFHETYGYLLETELKRNTGDLSVTVTNRAKRGATIKYIHQEIINNIFFFQPDVFILHVGIVDCWIRPELEQKQYVLLEDFIKYYLDIISYVKKRPEMKCIIIGICPTSMKMENRTPGLLLEIMKYDFVLKSEADWRQIFYINMEEHVSSDNPHKYLLPDDHHLNVEGNALVSRLILNIVIAILETNKAADLLKIDKTEEALNACSASFNQYPYYRENLYQLLKLCIESNDSASFQHVLTFYKGSGIQDDLIDQLITKH